MITNEQAAAVRALAATAPGVGYNYWDVDGTKTEIRPEPTGFTFSAWGAHGLSPVVVLGLVREAASRGKEIMFWQCCACGDKATSKALSNVSHGYCKLHAAELMAQALAAAKL
jgi:hypothetical protein